MIRLKEQISTYETTISTGLQGEPESRLYYKSSKRNSFNLSNQQELIMKKLNISSTLAVASFITTTAFADLQSLPPIVQK